MMPTREQSATRRLKRRSSFFERADGWEGVRLEEEEGSSSEFT